MRRRAFITLLGGAAVTWPLAARAQQSRKVSRVGILNAGGPILLTNWSMFTDVLHKSGWIEGKNLVFEHRYAENRLDRLPELAAELIRLNVGLLLALVARSSQIEGYRC